MIKQWVWGIAVSPFSAWPCLVACWTIPACIKTQWELKITRALLKATEVIFSTQWLHHFCCETDCFPWSNPLAVITDPSDPTLPLPLAYSQCGWLPNMVHIPSGRELLHSPLAWSFEWCRVSEKGLITSYAFRIFSAHALFLSLHSSWTYWFKFRCAFQKESRNFFFSHWIWTFTTAHTSIFYRFCISLHDVLQRTTSDQILL